MRFSVAFCTARIDISRQCWKRSFRLSGFFATEAETNLRHTLGRKIWLDHHFRDTIASSCFYTWGTAAGKEASGGCDQSSNFAQFCTEMHVFNHGFSYATHFSYNPACFKTAAKERIGYICSDCDWAHWCAGYSPTNRSNCENVFHKILTKLRMNVKNMMLHYWFPEDAKVKFSEIIILLMILSIFSGSHICTVLRSFNSGNGG